MINFSFDPDIKELFPSLTAGIMTGRVNNSTHDPALWKTILETTESLAPTLSPESIREMTFVKLGKDAYRKLGKDPNRYRVSSEALLRRLANGKGIYQINSLVDILNLVSIKTGITIGGFDLDKIMGGISLGIGKENEEFEAIGKGELNIHRLPVYRDSLGAIGSPTSDCVRTRITESTSRFMMIITGFFGDEGIVDCFNMLKDLISVYIYGRDFVIDLK
jgi:DNA/RNA-binding domain of Phe-tRNA-synthetase-like protein